MTLPDTDRLTTALVDDLASGASELRETHISWAFLFGQVVLKVKKPVNLGFVDFSTLERRRAACEAEVALNSRLAPGVYRGIVPVLRGADGRARFGARSEQAGLDLPARPGAQDEIVDWAVEMLRLPDRDRADVRLAEGRLDREHIEHLARELARFHASAATGARIDAFGSVASMAANVRENYSQAGVALREVVSHREACVIEAQQLGFLGANAA